MKIQVLTEFKLKIITLTGEAFSKIWPIYGPSLAQILSKIAKFELISEFSKIYHGNTHIDRVSSQNYHVW